MPTEIYVISGFLGAGKTTLIQKMLKELFTTQKTAVVENDFGEISIDAAALESSGVLVRAISSGCICCSLSGDFTKSLLALIQEYSPEQIIIEPSGVGKLSDISRLFEHSPLAELCTLKKCITIVDVKRCKMYLENFGEFFEDQIKHADTVLLSRTEQYSAHIPSALAVIRSLNHHAEIVDTPLDKLNLSQLFAPENSEAAHCACGCGGHHGDCCCHNHEAHHHHADEIFETVTLKIDAVFTKEEWHRRFSLMENELKEAVIRAKGIVKAKDGYLNLQYTPGELSLTDTQCQGDILNIIGKGLAGTDISAYFRQDKAKTERMMT